VIEHATNNHNIESSNPANGTKREKMVKELTIHLNLVPENLNITEDAGIHKKTLMLLLYWYRNTGKLKICI
jgi:hypothetical protein